MKIYLNGRYIQCGLVTSGDRMSIVMTGETTIREIYEGFMPESMPEVTILEDDGSVYGVYMNQRVTGVHWNSDKVQIDLQVDPLDDTSAQVINARIDAQEESTGISDGAIEELAALVADLDARVTALEGGEE